MYPQRRIEKIRKALKKKEAISLPAKDNIESSVIVPLFVKEGDVHILFTRRTGKVRDHKNQISFPGGVKDSADRSLRDTALREMWEEIGVAHKDIEILGKLDDIYTSTGYCISPFVGLIPHPYDFHINDDELDEILTFPLTAFMSRSAFREESHTYRGETHRVYYFDVKTDVTVWGATAKILTQFLEVTCRWQRPL